MWDPSVVYLVPFAPPEPRVIVWVGVPSVFFSRFSLPPVPGYSVGVSQTGCVSGSSLLSFPREKEAAGERGESPTGPREGNGLKGASTLEFELQGTRGPRGTVPPQGPDV